MTVSPLVIYTVNNRLAIRTAQSIFLSKFDLSVVYIKYILCA